MYNSRLITNDNLGNELATASVLRNIFFLVKEGLHDMKNVPDWEEPVILDKTYPSYGYEFVDDYIKKPDVILMVLKEYKDEILLAIKNYIKLPKSWKPKKYWELLVITVKFLYDKKVIVPCCDDKMWSEYALSYGETPIEAIEFIIASSFNEVFDFEQEIYRELLNEIKDKKTFKKACKKMMSFYCLSCAEERIDYLCDYANELYNEIKLDEKDFTKKDAYKEAFEDFFNKGNFSSTYMYDEDYLFCL